MPPPKANPDKPDHYILVTAKVDFEPCTTSTQIVEALAKNRVWLASSFTPFRRDYKRGDRILFYASGQGARCFLGHSEVAGPTTDATAKDEKLAEQLGLDGFAERIPLTAVRLWQKPLQIRPLVQRLSFITDKRNWGLHFRQAAVRIPGEDFQIILQEGDSANA